MEIIKMRNGNILEFRYKLSNEEMNILKTVKEHGEVEYFGFSKKFINELLQPDDIHICRQLAENGFLEEVPPSQHTITETFVLAEKGLMMS